MITSAIKTTGIDRLVADMGKHMKKEISLGVRDQLVIIEKDHKRKQIRRASSGKAIKRTWTTRDGKLEKSFHRDWRPGSLIGAYGSDLARAKIIEEGGTIRAKNSYLTIPTEHAPKDVWARYVPGLVFIQSLKGQPLLVKPTGEGQFITMYILRRQVKLPPRPALDRAVKNTEKARDDRMVLAVDRAIGATDAK